MQRTLCEVAKARPNSVELGGALADIVGFDADAGPWAMQVRSNYLLATTRCDGLSVVELFIRQNQGRVAYEAIRRTHVVAAFSTGEPPLVPMLRETLAPNPEDPPSRKALRACLSIHLAQRLAHAPDDARGARRRAKVLCEAGGLPDLFTPEAERGDPP